MTRRDLEERLRQKIEEDIDEQIRKNLKETKRENQIECLEENSQSSRRTRRALVWGNGGRAAREEKRRTRRG